MPEALSRAETLQVGGLQRFTSIDYPGQLAAVVFVQGCPWRCGYCHNAHLQPRSQPRCAGTLRWADVRAWLSTRRGLLDAVVFSGGEPTLDPALPAAVAEAKALGFRCGLHTAGISPRRLQALLPHLDWVGLDIKAPLDDDALYARVTGRRGSARAARTSLALVQASGVAYQCRTTVDPALLDDAAVERTVSLLRREQVPAPVLQPCRRPPTLAIS